MKIFSRIKAQLGRKPKEKPVTVVRLGEVDSTNSYLRTYQPAAEDEDMVVVTADHQTAGRGQGTNRWESAEGMNLLFSVLIHPSWIPVGRQFLLSEAGALAIKEVLDGYTEGITLKWPNDIYWHDYKLSGTLIETSLKAGNIDSCIFGIGIDVNQREFHSDAPNPISLCSITQQEEDIDLLLQRILDSFERYYNILINGGKSTILSLYHDSLYRRTGLYPYRDSDGIFMASIEKVEADGHLVLRDDEDKLRSYAFKEVAIVIPKR